MREYIVEVRNVFEAESDIDALAQMVAWLDENAYHAGYRIYGEDDEHPYGIFIDADSIDWNALNDDDVSEGKEDREEFYRTRDA